MEDSVKYITYNDYKAMGGTLDLMSFNLLEYQSRKQIDYYTCDRLMNGVPEDIKSEIKMTMMTLINENNNISKSSNMKSESIDGYSVTYGSNEENDEKIHGIIKQLLSGVLINGVPLLYIGGIDAN